MTKAIYAWEEYPEREQLLPVFRQYAPQLYNNKKRAKLWDYFTVDTFLTLLGGYSPIFLPLNVVLFAAARKGAEVKLRGKSSVVFSEMVRKYDLSHNAMTYVIQTFYNLQCCRHEPYTAKTFHTIKLAPMSEWVPELRAIVDSMPKPRSMVGDMAAKLGGLAQWVNKKRHQIRPYDDEELHALLDYSHDLLNHVPEAWRGAFYSYVIVNSPETTARLTSSFCSYSKEFRDALLTHLGFSDYVEVDYPAMIPSICALANGRRDVGFGGADLYKEILDFIKWDALTRSTLKLLMLTTIGSSSTNKAQRGMHNRFFENGLPLSASKAFLARMAEVPFLKGMVGTNKLRPAFIVESRLQLRNIRDIHQLTGAVAFPVYDCLYVPRSVELQARDIMQRNLLSMEVKL